jgi:hypothetical protein
LPQARINHRKVVHGIDRLHELTASLLDMAQVGGHLGVGLCGECLVRVSQDAVQRCQQSMAHARQELASVLRSIL